MRIVGGAMKGRTLAGLGKGDAAAALRPTPDRVRESLFNRLEHAFGDPIPGAVVLDLFAGTGALGLEALSRGAARAVFVENGRTGAGLIAENIRRTGTGDRARLIRRDARAIGAADGGAADVIFLDPPYGRELGAPALAAAAAGGWTRPGTLALWEEAEAMAAPGGWERIDARAYGAGWVTVLERGKDKG